jgi:hypothetical protein
MMNATLEDCAAIKHGSRAIQNAAPDEAFLLLSERLTQWQGVTS